MIDLAETLADIGWRRLAFTALVLVPLLIYVGLFEMWRNQLLLVTSWVGGFGLLEPVFYDPAHRLHEFAMQLSFWPFLLGLLAQLRSPGRHVTGMLMALLVPVSLAAAMVVSGFTAPLPIVLLLGVPTLLAALLHPAGRELVTSFDSDGVNRVLLALVVVAAVPLLAFTGHQVGLQTGAVEPAHDHAGAGHDEEVHEQHVEFGHFTFVTAFAFVVLVVGFLASGGLPGWRLGVRVTGIIVAVFAIAGILVPPAASNPGLGWNLAAIGWAVVFVGAGEQTAGGTGTSPM